MALRFLLVSLVAGLGITIPTGDEIKAKFRESRSWVVAQIDALSAPAPLPVAVEPDEDAAFAEVVDAMVSDFSADLARNDSAVPPEAIVAAVPSPAELPVEEVVAAYDPFAPSIDELDENPIEETDAVPEPVVEPAAIPLPSVSSAADSGRLGSAVQLTREAAKAWIDVLRTSRVTLLMN